VLHQADWISGLFSGRFEIGERNVRIGGSNRIIKSFVARAG
jgi:hypothetical protein